MMSSSLCFEKYEKTLVYWLWKHCKMQVNVFGYISGSLSTLDQTLPPELKNGLLISSVVSVRLKTKI